MTIKKKLEDWLEGLIHIDVAGGLTLKVSPTVEDISAYQHPLRWQSGAVAGNAANFLGSIMPPQNGRTKLITCITVYNNNRAAIPQVWCMTGEPSAGLVPYPESSAARDKLTYGNGMQHLPMPLVVPPNTGIQIRDNAYQAGDTVYFNVIYYEVDV